MVSPGDTSGLPANMVVIPSKVESLQGSVLAPAIWQDFQSKTRPGKVDFSKLVTRVSLPVLRYKDDGSKVRWEEF